jgi:peptidoglycan/LPS O-acetylase OafA/YrhL
VGVKFRYLDGLRGLAALIVVFDHLAFMYVPYAVNAGGAPHGLGPLLHNTPLQLLISGDLAVCIFFVLSGIVLSAKFFRTGEASVVMASAVKRYFRLAIPVLGSVIIAYGLMRLGLLFNHEAGALTSDWWKGFWGFRPDWWEAGGQGAFGVFTSDHNSYNPVLWTMKLEFVGSFMVFAVLLLFGRLRNRWAVYAVLGLLLWQTYYLAFLLGVVICDGWFAGGAVVSGRLPLRRAVWIPLLAASLLLGSFPTTGPGGTMFERWPFVPVQAHTAAAFGIIVAIMSSGLLKRLLEWRPVLFLGRISFPLYLLHFLVLGSYTSYLFVTLSGHMSLKAAMLVTLGPTFAVMGSAAYLYAKFVDEPAIRLSGRIYERWFGQRAETAPARAEERLAGADPAPERGLPEPGRAMVPPQAGAIPD